jgi:threonylcarbamoyladenosine tRNA methylthiotransferase MtaB
MRRPYECGRYRALVTDIRRRLPHASIGSDIIVGFPGETDEDFARLVAFLEASPLTQLHVFPYSDRPGTEASHLPGRVDGRIVRDRSRSIREIGQRLSGSFRRQLAGTAHRALVIDDGTSAVIPNGLRVRLPGRRPRNEWVDVRLEFEAESLRGEISAHAGSSVAAR